VHCSLREGLARVLPQAMLCAKPVVSFDIDGAKEVVNDTTGFLIEPKDVDGLTTACAKLIENPQLYQTLGQAGLNSTIEKFAPDTMVNTIEAVYQKLLQE
jgi:glycosyltransferase involved in cell wall biosynthesis